MTKLKKPVTLETAFGANVVDELLGEDGACRSMAVWAQMEHRSR